jgi:cation transport ATPase
MVGPDDHRPERSAAQLDRSRPLPGNNQASAGAAQRGRDALSGVCRASREAEPAALLVLAEELRDDTAAAVRYLLDQGITIKVLSGDAPRAVAAIAERAGIPVGGPPRDASALREDEIGDVLASANVLGRVQPEQKLAAVRALQAAGHVAAIAALTLWRRFGPGHRDQRHANSGLTTPSTHDDARL